jgi:hypothetical protein
MKVLSRPTIDPSSVKPERFTFGPFRLDCRTRELQHGSDAVALTPEAFETRKNHP